MKPAVFLDRDGVINRSVVRNGRPYPPDSLAEFEFLPGVIEGVSKLRDAGFEIVVATNQPDVATGKQQREVVEAMHARVRAELAIDRIMVCYHTDADECECRKPRPGMLLDASRKLDLDLGRSFMVGDRWRDIEAGQRAGCRTVLVECGYDERRADAPDWVVDSLFQASQVIVVNRR